MPKEVVFHALKLGSPMCKYTTEPLWRWDRLTVGGIPYDAKLDEILRINCKECQKLLEEESGMRLF